MPSSVITPAVNESLAPYQFDNNVVIGGANVSGGGSFTAPSVIGLKAWSFPTILATASGSAAITAQSLYLAQVNLAANLTYSNLYVSIGTPAAGAVPSTTASFAGLYYVNTATTAALVASTAQIGTAIGTTTGFKTLPLTTPFTSVNAGQYYLGVLVGTGSVPALTTSAGATVTTSATVTAGPLAAAAQYPFAVNGTGISALPTSLTLSSSTLTGAYNFWCGAA